MKVNELFYKTLLVRFKTSVPIVFNDAPKTKPDDIIEIHKEGEFQWFVVNGKIASEKLKRDFMWWFDISRRKNSEVLYEK